MRSALRRRHPALATVGSADIQSSANGSGIAAVPGTTDQFYGMTDRGPNVDGRTDNEKILPVPDFHPQIAVFQLTDGTATPGRPSSSRVPTANSWLGWSIRGHHRRNPGHHRRASASPVRSRPGHRGSGRDARRHLLGVRRIRAVSGPLRRERQRNRTAFTVNGSLPLELSLRSANQGMEGLTITPTARRSSASCSRH